MNLPQTGQTYILQLLKMDHSYMVLLIINEYYSSNNVTEEHVKYSLVTITKLKPFILSFSVFHYFIVCQIVDYLLSSKQYIVQSKLKCIL